MLLLVYHKHTQWAGPGRTEQNVVGFPMLPVYAAKAGGFFFMVFGVIAIMGGFMSINPVWRFGPYNPSEVTAGSQPDWYMGWPDGALRIFPNLESHFWGHTLSWNVFLPIIVLPGLVFTAVLMLPFIEAFITGDKREHHLLQRPRNNPTRTSIMAGFITFYGLMWAAGGNDILATQFHLNLNQITYFMRVAVFVGPVLAFFVTRRWCISLQRHDNEMLLHGYESGIIMRDAAGGYSERHLPLNEEHAYALAARSRDQIFAPESEIDGNGVAAPTAAKDRLRGKLSNAWYANNIQAPSHEELEEARHHAAHQAELEADLDHPVDGHEFDDHNLRETTEIPLRGGN
jgi:ubiquinol-cytochrome c reductase cytochrome b subunit